MYRLFRFLYGYCSSCIGVNNVKQAIDSNQNPLVLTERRDHAQLLHQLLVDKGFDALLLVGAMKAKEP